MIRLFCVFLVVSLGSQAPSPVWAQSSQEESPTPRELEAEREPVELDAVVQETDSTPESEATPTEEESPQEEDEAAQVEEQPEEGVSAEAPPTQVSEEGSPPEPRDPSAGLVFQFTNVPLTTVIDTVMRELGYSYVIDPQVAGTASIYTMGEIPREKAFEVLEQLLQMNGQGIVKQEDRYVFVPLGQTTKIPHGLIVDPQVPSGGEEEETPPLIDEAAPAPPGSVQTAPVPQSPQPQSPFEAQPVVSVLTSPQEETEGQEGPEGVLTYIISLHYVPSADMLTMITPFVSNGA
ncbi:MAG: hypothetical protein V3R94_03415, partial [Acidobacteriota bacterium]